MEINSAAEANRLDLENRITSRQALLPSLNPTDALRVQRDVSNLQSINSDTLAGDNTPIIVPTPTPSTGAAGLSGFTTSYGESQKALQAKLDKQAEEAKQVKDTEKTGLMDTLSQYLGVQSGRGTVEKEAGLDVKAQKVTDYTNQLEALDRAEINETRALEGVGLTDVQRGANQREIQRKYAFQKADVALLQSAANRDYETAFNIVNRKIELQLEPLKTKLEFQKLFYDENKDIFNKAEQRQFDSLIKESEREYETEKTNKTAIANIQLEALKNGIKLPSFVVSELNRATSQEEINQVLVRNGVSLADPLERQIKQAQLEGLNANTRKTNASITGAGVGSGVAGLTPEQQADPFIKLLQSTAGGKPITDTFAQSLNKGLNVLGQIGALQANIQNTKTGPLAGAFRGANPWDTNAQTIKAQLNAIIPNLARGVYGEVGVLTDNDIKQYAKTLPTLTSTEDIRNAVLGITVDMIGKSVKRTLEINAANQKDVSGFVDIYTEMNNTRNSIFTQIPGYKGAGTRSLQSVGVSKTEEDLFDSVVTSTTAGGGGFFRDIWNGLIGK